MTWGRLSLTGVVGRWKALGSQEENWKTKLERYHSSGFLGCQECRNGKDNRKWYSCSWPIKSRTWSFYVLEQCLTNLTGTKQHEN